MSDTSAPMTRPKIVCLDLGGVVVRICRSWEEGCAAANVPVRGNLGGEGDNTAALRKGAVDRYQRGITTHAAFLDELSAILGGAYTTDELDRIHAGWILGDYSGVAEMLRAIAALGMRVACLSNTNAAHWRQMDATSAAFAAISVRHASHLLGLHKPDAAIYAAFEASTGCTGDEIFFADDLIENVDAARARGWQAIHIDHIGDPAAQILDALALRGVTIARHAVAPCEIAPRAVAVADMPSPILSRLACGGGTRGGTIKVRASDFLVDELPLYEPAGAGEHLYLGVQKQDMTHDEMLRVLAEHFQVDPATIGTAGKKDRRAVTRQTVSIGIPGAEPATELTHDRLVVLWAKRHGNKLRTGHLVGNRFAIRVREIDPLQAPAVYKRLRHLIRCGVPNGFGPQRFGQRLNNHRLGRLVLEENWVGLIREVTGTSNLPFPEHQRQARLACDQEQWSASLPLWAAGDFDERKLALAQSRGWTASRSVKSLGGATLRFWVNALQSALFNRVLDRRIAAERLNTISLGDVAYRHAGGACFVVDGSESSESLAARSSAFEISPTGPMFGSRMLAATDATAEDELAALRALGVNLEQFTGGSHPPSGERRPLRIALANASLDSGTDEFGGYIRVAFDLPAGAFATVVLNELFGPIESGLP
ncbi:MAG: tRNA pseudouridine(13) synthase TruD [Phycisphaerales bacterium]|nr:tRNA pseudouridine(13) synthase TruD [Phycisphaerales bacterium]